MQDLAPSVRESERTRKKTQESFDAINIKRVQKKQVDQFKMIKKTRRKEQFIAGLVLTGLIGLVIASLSSNGLHLKEILISSLIIGGITIIRVLGKSDINEA